MDLLDSYEFFCFDLSLMVIKVDDGSKKMKFLIDVYDICGVLMLVINNEKYIEGDDVFLMLLLIEDDVDIWLLLCVLCDMVVVVDGVLEVCGIEFFVEEELFDFDNLLVFL